MPVTIGLQFTEGSQVLATGESSTVIGIVGTAAIGTPNVPFLITSMAEAIARFGYNTAGATIPNALARAYSSYGQIRFVVVNVAAPAVVAVAPTSYTFNNQDKIQLPHRHIATPVVTAVGGTPVYVLDTDYTVDLVRGIIQRKGSAIPAGASVLAGYSRPDFAAVTATQIVGGVNAGTGKREGLEALIDAEFVDLSPSNIGIIIAPGFSTLPTVIAKLSTLSDRLRAEYVLDAPATATIAEVQAGRTAGAAPVAHFATRDKRAILCYPNPITGIGSEAKEEWFSIHVAEAMATNPNWRSLTNLEIKGVTGWKTSLLTSASDPLADNQKLADNGIVSYRNRNGRTPVFWGHFNAAYPIENPAEKGLDRIHFLRIVDAIKDQVDLELASYVGMRLGMAWGSAVAVIEASISRIIGENEGVDSGKIEYMPLASDLPNRKLAFRLEVKIPDVLDVISVDLVFVL
jgi:phage tail sheath protein FI